MKRYFDTNRSEWKLAYRLARVIHKTSPNKKHIFNGAVWKALLILGDRNVPDSLLSSPHVNREIYSILKKIT